MRRFSADEISTVIHAADERLAEPGRIVIIGGTAIGLLASPCRSTTDLDVLPNVSPAVIAAFDEAIETTGLRVPIQPVGIVEGPEGMEERLQLASIPGLMKLEVLVPERHDLAIMKVTRGNEHDLQAVEALHSRLPLDPDILIERFRETWVVGRRSNFQISYLVLVERLFGESMAEAQEIALEQAD